MNGNAASEKMESVKQGAKEAVTNDWDYKLALGVITVLAFLTRFWGISHPNQVVFDEVHFGKVCRVHILSVLISRSGGGKKWDEWVQS